MLIPLLSTRSDIGDLLRFMLVPNPGEMPSPSSVLASVELQAFEDLVNVQFNQSGGPHLTRRHRIENQ